MPTWGKAQVCMQTTWPRGKAQVCMGLLRRCGSEPLTHHSLPLVALPFGSSALSCRASVATLARSRVVQD